MRFMQTSVCLLRRTVCVTALMGVMASPASADLFDLVYTGNFSTANALNLQGAAAQNFAAPTPFTITALFDTASPNIVAPVGVPGFVAYSPLSAVLSVGGQDFNLTTYNQNLVSGVTVTVFDDTTPFGLTPSGANHYGVGIIANPLMDGAGIVGDWVSASPTFSAANLVSTEFTGYTGVGYGSGPLDPNMNPTIVPMSMTDALGQTWSLTLGNYDEEFAQGAPLNTARITAVPEPGSLALLMGAGVTGAGFLLRRRARRQRHQTA